MTAAPLSLTSGRTLVVAGHIIERAAKMGIPVEDIIIDPLVMTVGHNSKAATVTLKAIELIRKEYGVNMSLGASNVSFGLPDRHSVNSAFLALAIQAGVTCSITDPITRAASWRAANPAGAGRAGPRPLEWLFLSLCGLFDLPRGGAPVAVTASHPVR